VAAPRNWGRAASLWFPISTMPANGPVVLTDETQTILWFTEQPSRDAIDHKEHARNDAGEFLFDDDRGQQVARMKTRKVKPAYWCPAVVEG
jgi:hypothetical protein